MSAAKLIAQLERETFNPNEGTTAERAYRRGWNDRSVALIQQLRVEAGLDELRWVPAWDRQPTLPIADDDLDHRFDLGGES